MSQGERIVSLLPSATETVCALGLGNRLVGVTHECDWPPAVGDLPKVTRTLVPTDAASGEIDALVRERMDRRGALYELDLPVLERLAPDLIVTQALCGVCAVAEDEVREAACRLPGGPEVVNLEPHSLEEVFEAIGEVADAAGVAERGRTVVGELRSRVAASDSTGTARPARVALLEWLDPPFACGHWNPELVRLAGGEEVLGGEGEPSRRVTWAEVADAAPEVVVVACCGFDVERTLEDVEAVAELPEWRRLPAVRDGRVFVVDGSQYFSRPGPRLVDGLELLAHAIGPGRHPLPDHLAPPRRLAPRLTEQSEASATGARPAVAEGGTRATPPEGSW